MPVESAIQLRLRTDKEAAEQFNKPHLITRPSIQRKNCWNDYQNTDMIDTVLRGWNCSPIYVIREENENDIDQDLVFDGAHRLEAVINFIADKFALKKKASGEEDETSPLNDLYGKKFSDLTKAIQNKIKNYEFTLNYIDEETADSKASLKILWERLNKSGQRLNDYELALPVISELVNHVLKPSLPLILESILFPKAVSNRGEAERILQILLATSEGSVTDPHMKDFTSKKGLVKKWQTHALGKKITEIKENTTKNKEKWLQLLRQAFSYMDALSQANCFVDDSGNNLLKPAHRGTELVFLLGRAVHHFPKAEDFRRICPDIAKHMKGKYFTQIIRDEAGRNGNLQRRLLRDIDKDLESFAELKERRLFTTLEIGTKLVMQGNTCPLCNEAILPHHKIEGDHIIPWSKGGKTILENCQVTHAKCNKTK